MKLNAPITASELENVFREAGNVLIEQMKKAELEILRLTAPEFRNKADYLSSITEPKNDRAIKAEALKTRIEQKRRILDFIRKSSEILIMEDFKVYAKEFSLMVEESRKAYETTNFGRTIVSSASKGVTPPRPVSARLRCRARGDFGVQCQLKKGHKEQHFAGTQVWSTSDAK